VSAPGDPGRSLEALRTASRPTTRAQTVRGRMTRVGNSGAEDVVEVLVALAWPAAVEDEVAFTAVTGVAVRVVVVLGELVELLNRTVASQLETTALPESVPWP